MAFMKQLYNSLADVSYAASAMGKDKEKSKSKPKKQSSIAERMSILGIPEKEMTQAVGLAISALLEKLDDVSAELDRTKENLSELEQLVDVDCIAPIPNRRAFMRRLSWAIAMFERYNHPSSILYFDVNNFKEINDTYGHAAGDLAIKHVSKILLDTMRESDFIARIGGDEFAIIMYYADHDGAEKRGRMIAEKIRSSTFVYNGRSISLSAALGSHAIRSGETADTALAAADMAMYVDKRRSKEQATNIKA